MTSPEARDRRVMQLYEQLLEIERRLIPTGLHIFGRPSKATERAGMLKMIASFPRPESGTRGLPELVAEGLGLALEQTPGGSPVVTEVAARERDRIDAIVSEAINQFELDGIEAAVASLAQRANVPAVHSRTVFTLLETISQQLETNSEIEALLRALRGEFIEPGPGTDIIQNPAILPTGRNTHAINPYAVPSVAAFARAEVVARKLLERYEAEHGRYPRSMALVLWGLDNIKTQGEGVAQALWLLGVRPIADSLNRITSIEPIPLAALGRPRIDVVMDSQWEGEDTLGDLFVTRKCFAYGRDSQGKTIEGVEARTSMDRALARVEATYQNIDTFEIGITDVDHYFEYLGGISK